MALVWEVVYVGLFILSFPNISNEPKSNCFFLTVTRQNSIILPLTTRYCCNTVDPNQGPSSKYRVLNIYDFDIIASYAAL